MYGIIYLITCKVNEKRYVGQTTDAKPDKYIDGHFAAARNGGKKLLYNAIRKYGAEAFTTEIIWYCPDKASLDISEDSFIQLFETMAPKGYNLKGGGSAGKFSEEAKINLRAGLKNALSTPEAKARKSIASKEVHSRPGMKDKRSAIARISQNSSTTIEKRNTTNLQPEVIERRRSAQKRVMKDPKRRESVKNTLHNPEVDAKRKETCSQPEIKEKHRSGVTAAHARPGFKERLIKSLKKASSTPAARLERSIIAKETHARPGAKEMRSEAIKHGLANPDIQERLSKRLSGTCWINNGEDNRHIMKDEPLPSGWSYGTKPRVPK